MHATYMHEFCNDLVVIIMICNDLWEFSIDPPYFGYNSTEQENPVLCIVFVLGTFPYSS
jgi:hypothetical protein